MKLINIPFCYLLVVFKGRKGIPGDQVGPNSGDQTVSVFHTCLQSNWPLTFCLLSLEKYLQATRQIKGNVKILEYYTPSPSNKKNAIKKRDPGNAIHPPLKNDPLKGIILTYLLKK